MARKQLGTAPSDANDAVRKQDAEALIGLGVYVSGADKTGATDCLSVLQGIINAAPSGSTIHFPAGTFLISGQLLINKTLKIVGSGGRINTFGTGDAGWTAGTARANTTIITSSATANGIKVTGRGVIIEDIAVVNTRVFASAPTAGTGILFEGTNHYAMSRVTVNGFYDCVRTDGHTWTFDSCNFYSPVRYGIFITSAGDSGDAGDCGISNCVLATARVAVAAVRWESGGGVRWVNNKINYATYPGAWEYGIDLAIGSGVGTGEMTFIGGAITWCTKAGIRFVQSGSGSMQRAVISGIIFQGIGSDAPDSVAVELKATTDSYGLNSIIVTDCSFFAFFGGSIVVDAASAVMIGPNTHVAEQSPGGPGVTKPLIKITNGSRLVDVHRQNYSLRYQSQAIQTQTITIIEDLRNYGNGRVLDGFVDYKYKQNVCLNTVANGGLGPNVWVTMFTIEPSVLNGSGIIDVQLSALENSSADGVQPVTFVKQIRRSYHKNNTSAGGAIYLATVGTDLSPPGGTMTPNYSELQIVDAGSGKVKVQIRMTSADALALNGEIQVNVVGRVQKFSLGDGI